MVRRRASRGFTRQVRRKFVWDRTFGTIAPPNTGVDLLAGFRAQPGGTHLGATITRIRGYIIPSEALSTTAGAGVLGMRIDSWNEDPAEPDNQPVNQPDEDWLAWLPWNVGTGTLRMATSWNENASLWTVDVKSQRKLEELNQTLWLFGDQTGGADRTYFYNLSIGLKLA